MQHKTVGTELGVSVVSVAEWLLNYGVWSPGSPKPSWAGRPLAEASDAQSVPKTGPLDPKPRKANKPCSIETAGTSKSPNPKPCPDICLHFDHGSLQGLFQRRLCSGLGFRTFGISGSKALNGCTVLEG